MKKGLSAMAVLTISAMLCIGCSGNVQTTKTTEMDTQIDASEQVEDDSKEITEVSSDEVSESTEESTETTSEESTEESTAWSPQSLKKGLITAVEYDKYYDAEVKSEEDAKKVIKQYGDMQRENYSNPEVEAIESKIENDFGILSVTLGEMDVETAQDVYDACKYMFETYPSLEGSLTDITLGNLTIDALALTREQEFVTNGKQLPKVLKREVVLNASTFLRRDRLLEDCKYQEETGFWPHNASISMIVVHELGHHLLSNQVARYYGFYGNYVTKENANAYYKFSSDALKNNQEIPQMVLKNAYERWKENNEGTEEEFRSSISQYASGIQKDGGISYSETVAESVADIYVNGDNAAEASKLIVEEMMKLESK